MKHPPAQIIAASLWMLLHCGHASAAPADTARLTAQGASTPLLTNDQRAQLEIKFGPDAPVDFYQGKNGKYYLNSAGGLGPVGGRGRFAAWNLHVDSQLTQILALHGDGPATGPEDVQTLMTDHAAECGAGKHRVSLSASGGLACAQYFDRDYAGGGTYYRCPDNATSVLFYHGENHTAPDGSAGHGGWFGLGAGIFNADETAITPITALTVAGGQTSGQIIGLNLSTIWSAEGGSYVKPPQEHPYNGVASAVAAPDGYLYLYHGNATLDPAYNPSACRPECMSVSRAPVAAFCRSVRTASPVPWMNYYHGSWTEPAVLDGRSSLGLGAGGPFTPLMTQAPAGEHGGSVTYLPTARLFVMTRLLKGGVSVRLSSDGLRWTEPQPLLAEPTGQTPSGEAEQLLYPRISVLHTAQGERYVLTYVVATKGHFWQWAEFMRQPLALTL